MTDKSRLLILDRELSIGEEKELHAGADEDEAIESLDYQPRRRELSIMLTAKGAQSATLPEAIQGFLYRLGIGYIPCHLSRRAA